MRAPERRRDQSPFVWHFSADEPIHDWSQPHAWLCDLDVVSQRGGGDLSPLSLAERQRAQRFKSSELQRRFVASRHVLRNVLARCLAVDPSDLQFGHGPFGKPFVSEPQQPLTSHLHFNLSHSEHLLLLAVTLDREIGTDIEILREDFDWPSIAESYFTREEVRSLTRLLPAAATREFYRLWTRQEALIKCTGRGITQPSVTRWDQMLIESDATGGKTPAVFAIAVCGQPSAQGMSKGATLDPDSLSSFSRMAPSNALRSDSPMPRCRIA